MCEDDDYAEDEVPFYMKGKCSFCGKPIAWSDLSCEACDAEYLPWSKRSFDYVDREGFEW
jgi:hypothetical protein